MQNEYTNSEYCNPFDKKTQNFFMKLEHCGRYLYAYDNILPTDTIADISCATGYGSNFLAQKAKSVIGCDINSHYINSAKKNYVKQNLSFIELNLQENINILKDKINTIVSFETIEHTTAPFEVIKKFYNILPQGGKLFLSFPNEKYEIFDTSGKNMDKYHLSIIKYDKMLTFLQDSGFTINKILGQSLINNIISQIIKIEKDLAFSFDNLFNYSQNNIINQSRLLAYPNEKNIEQSYSFIFNLSKT